MCGFLLACGGGSTASLLQGSLVLVVFWFIFAMAVGFRRPVAAASTCFRCGYDLRGLPEGRGCPECGVSRADRERPTGRTTWDRATLPMLRLALWASLFLIAFGVLTARPLLQAQYNIRYGPGRINPALAEDISLAILVLFAMLMPFVAGAPRRTAPRWILGITIAACVLHAFAYTGLQGLMRR